MDLFSQKYLEYVRLITEAHQDHTNQFGKTERRMSSGEKIPYFFHSLWCSITIITEPDLPERIRLQGSVALLFHDVLEDTTVKLPSDLGLEVATLIQDLTVSKEAKYNFSGFEKEKLTLLQEPVIIQLLKLYDKVATLYDGTLPKERLKVWCDLTEKLAENVEQEFGGLRIVGLARMLIRQYNF